MFCAFCVIKISLATRIVRIRTLTTPHKTKLTNSSNKKRGSQAARIIRKENQNQPDKNNPVAILDPSDQLEWQVVTHPRDGLARLRFPLVAPEGA